MRQVPTGLFDLLVNNVGFDEGTAVTPATTTGSLLGKPFPLIVGITGSAANVFSTQAAGVNLSVTAAEYWPYADAAGNALYDAATGAAL